MKLIATISALVLALASDASGLATGSTIRTAAELYAATYSEASPSAVGHRFELTVRITMPRCERAHGTMAFDDDTGAMIASTDCAAPQVGLSSGDRVLISGTINADYGGNLYASCQRIEKLSPGPAPDPAEITGTAFYAGELDCRPVRVSGTVTDAFVDEIDPDHMFLILDCNGSRIPVASESEGRTPADCEALIGLQMSIVGVCRPGVFGSRIQFGKNVRTTPENIHVADTRRPDPFATQTLSSHQIQLREHATSLKRSKVCGRILAIWQGNKLLIRGQSGQLSRIELIHGLKPLPSCGESIEAVGFPETDLYRINLTRCLWRRCAAEIPLTNDIKAISARHLFIDDNGRERFDADYHGKRVRIQGIVHSPPLDTTGNARFLLECDSCLVTIDIFTCPEAAGRIETGSRIEVDGICVMDTESWSPSSPFPHVKEMFISVPTASDIRILANPPWWTPGRLLTVISGLFLITCGSLFWILSLKHRVNVKSRELKSEITARLASDLKSRERTRLAVELHDSIAQNLSGTTMEIGSAIQFAANDRKEMLRHLEIASRTLHACRDELRDCLWDLRSKALEDEEMNGAIRTTLLPYVSDVTLHVRFNVPRNRFSDNTAHAILRIIRELTLNAVRHGQATTIRIAGSLENRRLMFSVQDDGSGFDPANRPGVAQGHFGLEGVRERVNRFGGELRISSKPGLGAKVTVSMDAIPPEEEDLATL